MPCGALFWFFPKVKKRNMSYRLNSLILNISCKEVSKMVGWEAIIIVVYMRVDHLSLNGETCATIIHTPQHNGFRLIIMITQGLWGQHHLSALLRSTRNLVPSIFETLLILGLLKANIFLFCSLKQKVLPRPPREITYSQCREDT